MKKVLVLAGGGALGLMQLKALAELEKQSGKKVYEIYDMIVGTSVGAISGAVLASGMSATEYLEIFYENVDSIFKTRIWRIPILSAKYSRKNFVKMFVTVFGKKDFKMSELKTKFMCTSVNRIGKKTEYFKSWKSDENVLDCLLRSFAAPYYFGQLVDVAKLSIWFDGGMGTANLPIDIAYSESIKFGWWEKNLCITGITCGDIDREPKDERDRKSLFDKMKNQKTIRQVLDYIHPADGGMARIQSSNEKKYRYSVMSENLPNFEFRLIDLIIAEKYNKLDAVEYKDKFIEYGEQMCDIIKTNNWKW